MLNKVEIKGIMLSLTITINPSFLLEASNKEKDKTDASKKKWTIRDGLRAIDKKSQSWNRLMNKKIKGQTCDSGTGISKGI